MRNLFTILTALMITSGLASCKKCVECKAKDGPGGSEKTEEYCGTQAQRTEFTDTWMTTYAAAGYKDVSCN